MMVMKVSGCNQPLLATIDFIFRSVRACRRNERAEGAEPGREPQKALAKIGKAKLQRQATPPKQMPHLGVWLPCRSLKYIQYFIEVLVRVE